MDGLLEQHQRQPQREERRHDDDAHEAHASEGPHREAVRGFVFDVKTGKLREVTDEQQSSAVGA